MTYLEAVLKTTHNQIAVKVNVNPYDDTLNPLEDDMTTAVYNGLQDWRRNLFRGINADNVQQVLTRLNDPAMRQKLRDAIANYLMQAAEAGATQAREDVERDVFGVKQIEPMGITINWDLANNNAIQWALRYAENLVGEIAMTTTPRIQRLIADWINNGEPLSALVNRVADGWLYSESRARTIAVTEVTRAFAQGNMEAWRSTGVMDLKRWNTAVDELVCPICGPLHRKTVPMNEQFPGGYDGPPAHPRCRCWLTSTTDFEDKESKKDAA